MSEALSPMTPVGWNRLGNRDYKKKGRQNEIWNKREVKGGRARSGKMQTRAQEEKIGKGEREQDGRGRKCKPVIFNGRTTRDGNGERLHAKKQ